MNYLKFLLLSSCISCFFYNVCAEENVMADVDAGVAKYAVAPVDSYENEEIDHDNDEDDDYFANLQGVAHTFDEALSAAYENNPGWKASITEVRVAMENLKQAERMAYLPDVAGTVRSSRMLKEEKEQQTPWGRNTNTNSTIGITVTQNLFNGFADTFDIDAASDALKAAHYKLLAAEQKLVLDVLEAYANVWGARKIVNALKKKESNLKQTLDSQKESLLVGTVTETEVAQAEANYQKAIYERINAQTQLFSAIATFEKLTNFKAGKSMQLPKFKLELPAKLKDLISEALRNNSSILYYRYSELAAQSTFRSAVGKLSPKCELELRSHRLLNKDTDTHNWSKERSRNEHSIGVNFSVPIYSNNRGGNAYSAIAISDQKALQAGFSYRDAVRDVRKECVVTWAAYSSASAMIESSSSAVESAQKSTAGNLEESAMGLKSNIDVLVKENQLLESKVDCVNSTKQELIAKVKIHSLTGNLTASMLLDLASKQQKVSAQLDPQVSDKKQSAKPVAHSEKASDHLGKTPTATAKAIAKLDSVPTKEQSRLAKAPVHSVNDLAKPAPPEQPVKVLAQMETVNKPVPSVKSPEQPIAGALPANSGKFPTKTVEPLGRAENEKRTVAQKKSA